MLDRDMIASHRVRKGSTAVVTALPVLELIQCYISWSCKTDASVVHCDVSHEKVMRVLCEAGADKGKSIAHNVTPLSVADAGADTDKPKSEGLTPLHAARWTNPTLAQVRAYCFTNSSK